MEEIILEISADGKRCQIEVNGVVGESCAELTRPLEEALGMVNLNRTEKAEFHQLQTQAEHVRSRR